MIDAPLVTSCDTQLNRTHTRIVDACGLEADGMDGLPEEA